MSETQMGSTTPSTNPTAGPSTQMPPAATAEPVHRGPEPTGWVGWIMFAAVMMLMLGMFHAIAGLVALFQDSYYLVTKNDLVVHVNYTTWGWVHLIGGIVIVLAGVGLLAGQMWARIVGVGLAVLSAVVNMAFFAAYPWWSALMITFDVLVIWALTAHGAEMKGLKEAR
ncbi:DUF7144 family membrane protein [Nocardioides panaciterrulae]|uniref:DUF7144 domain-containing protein n=1 Tax=Nocardioides panaciterrulae TaxID=661492 RepID=A0A7Y9E3Z4_9ACTN|nr:hypothetical protein [Nocardioides panaciterrulae]NYD40547.1 hypothetical protein [Nocardioides panaciterrulae]